MKKILIYSLLLFCTFASRAQELQQHLYKAGFENVLVREHGDSLSIYFEHRDFRNPAYSLQYARQLLPDSLQQQVFFIPLEHNSPMGVYGEGNEFSPLSREDRAFFRKNNSTSKGYRFSFRIHPDF